MNKKDLYFILFSLSILTLLVFPVFGVGNRVYPFVFGVPFSLFWIISCIIVQFLGILLFLYYDRNKK